MCGQEGLQSGGQAGSEKFCLCSCSASLIKKFWADWPKYGWCVLKKDQLLQVGQTMQNLEWPLVKKVS